MPRPLALAPLALTVLMASCGGESTPLSSDPVVFRIPWTLPETSSYRLIEKDEGEQIGTAELRIAETRAGGLEITQSFRFPERQITNNARVIANAETLEPVSVTYSVDAPDGPLDCQATYSDQGVIIERANEEDTRTDELDVPRGAFDTWTDLFLWRTIAFGEGFEITYESILTCSLAPSERIKETLEVKELETVSVPAGTFPAWRVDIRSGGGTQHAWFSDTPERTLLRYDNPDLLFELISVE